MLRNVTANIPEDNQFEDLVKKENDRFSQILEKLNLKGIESWTEQQQQSVKRLLGVPTSIHFKFKRIG